MDGGGWIFGLATVGMHGTDYSHDGENHAAKKGRTRH